MVLERWPEPYPLPRAVHFDHEVGRILQSVRHRRRRCAAITEPAEIYEWRNGDGHDAAALRARRRRRVRAGPSRRCSTSPRSRRCSSGEPRAARRRRPPRRRGHRARARTTTASRVATERRRRSVAARYVVGCDGANSTVRTLLGVAGDRPRVLLRLAHRRRRPRTTTACSTRSTCRSATRPDRPPWCPAGPGGAGGSSCASPHETARASSNDERGPGSCSRRGTCTPDNATPRAPRRLHLPRPLRRRSGGTGGSSSPVTPPTRCRRSPGRACAPASATPPTWPGSSTSCSPAQAADGAARHLRPGAPAQRPPGRSSSRSSSARSSASPTPPRPRRATRPWRRSSAANRPTRRRLPGIDRRAHRPRLRHTPAAVRAGHRRRPLVRRRPRRRLAPRHHRRRAPLDLDPAVDDVVRVDRRRASSTRRPPTSTRTAAGSTEHDVDLGAATTRLPPLRHRHLARRCRRPLIDHLRARLASPAGTDEGALP